MNRRPFFVRELVENRLNDTRLGIGKGILSIFHSVMSEQGLIMLRTIAGKPVIVQQCNTLNESRITREPDVEEAAVTNLLSRVIAPGIEFGKLERLEKTETVLAEADGGARPKKSTPLVWV